MSIKGFQFVVDEEGRKQAVLIDLKQHGHLWEDFYETCLAQQRASEPRETIDQVKKAIREKRD